MSCSYVLAGHTDIVLCLDTCISNSGRTLIVTGSKDNTVSSPCCHICSLVFLFPFILQHHYFSFSFCHIFPIILFLGGECRGEEAWAGIAMNEMLSVTLWHYCPSNAPSVTYLWKAISDSFMNTLGPECNLDWNYLFSLFHSLTYGVHLSHRNIFRF